MRMRATCRPLEDLVEGAVTYLDIRARTYEACVDALSALLPADHRIIRFKVDRG